MFRPGQIPFPLLYSFIKILTHWLRCKRILTPDCYLFFYESSNDAGINILFNLNDEKDGYLPYLHNELIKMQISILLLLCIYYFMVLIKGQSFSKEKHCSTDNYSMQKVIYLCTFWCFVPVTVLIEIKLPLEHYKHTIRTGRELSLSEKWRIVKCPGMETLSDTI